MEERVLSYLFSAGFSSSDPVREIDLAERFKVSHTPIREVLNNLEAKGFVERRKRKGTYLKSFSMKELNEMYDIRGALEGLAAGLLCGVAAPAVIGKLRAICGEYEKNKPGRSYIVLSEIDFRFHSFIVESCRNERLVSLVRDYHVITKTLRRSSGEEYVHRSAFENPFTHEDIVGAVERAEPEEAGRLARRHVEWAKENTLKRMLAGGRETLGLGG